ncbi:hypothetical protein OG894_42735 (plasmid) [Streptomyces sp. NBC_01724]|uniref:hypothetical protein n=1 Tax=unclassified Streptomyces TaxID=2593676 RepID=UPI002E2FE9C6|nr:hypothetical protein [Streptomyces sp. NBC_01724]
MDDVLAGTRAVYLHCLLAVGQTAEELAAQDPDPGRQIILPVLKQQGLLANQPGPFGYGVLDGSRVPEPYIEVIPLDGAHEVVLASDGYLTASPTLDEAERALAASIALDPLRITNPGTKAVEPDRASFDDRAYVRLTR